MSHISRSMQKASTWLNAYRNLGIGSAALENRSLSTPMVRARDRRRSSKMYGNRSNLCSSTTTNLRPTTVALLTHSIRSDRHERSFDAISTFRTRPRHFGSTRSYHTTPHHNRWTSKIGAEPGVDSAHPHHQSDSPDHHPYPSAESEIRIIDYSDKQIVQHEPTKDSLESFLSSNEKPDWAACRWIYVNGLDWRTVSCLARRKGLHRLALEDVLDTSTPTKVDWYDGHCFMEMTLQKLVNLEHARDGKADSNEAGLEHDILETNRNSRKWRTLFHQRFGMSVEQVSIFLTTDNTVITIFERSGADILTPIMTRLESPQTIVRSSNDPSMLLHAVIDAVVDLSIPIVKATGDAFGELELAVLTTPAVAQSKQLYILRSGLTLLMDNITATDGLIKMLCDHRAVTLPSNNISITPLTQVYLQDVQDHVRTLSNSTHIAMRSAENLTSLIFNTIAASQNESVRQLTLVSSFFLPLTFLTGYFGMNFDPMPVVNEHSDAFFWVIASPVMAGTLLFLASRAGWLRSRLFFRSARGKKMEGLRRKG